jgi:hypothetical protein
VKLYYNLKDTFRWSTEHFDHLSDYYSTSGLTNVETHLAPPKRATFRAFHDSWIALNTQVLPALTQVNVEAGRRAKELLEQMRKEAEVDGVFFAAKLKTIVGMKPT